MGELKWLANRTGWEKARMLDSSACLFFEKQSCL